MANAISSMPAIFYVIVVAEKNDLKYYDEIMYVNSGGLVFKIVDAPWTGASSLAMSLWVACIGC